MTVLVAIPYYGMPEYIWQAVRSVLDQTQRDTIVLVAGDGETPPVRDALGSKHLRIVTFPTNEGAPLTQQAMLFGSPYEWYAPMGADDWLDPEYIERLMSLGTKANASGEIWHNDYEQSLVHDRAHTEFGVFDTELLRSIGGYGGWRCGQDTLLYEDILPNVSPVAYLDEPHYHKRLHAGSLTSSPETGYASPYRTRMVEHNHAVRARCAEMGWDVERIKLFRDSLLDERQRSVLAERIEMVRAAL